MEALVRGLALTALALLTMPAILSGKSLPAQTAAPQSAIPAQQRKPAKHTYPRRRAAAPPPVAPVNPQPAPEAIFAPAAPPAPIWPADQPPSQAKVTWDGRGLEIEASNSSLDQILHQVAVDTGAKLEGLAQDQRIFGTYGPGAARDVLAELLDGSGYNVLMIGGRDSQPPLEVVLTANSPTGAQTTANSPVRSSQEDDDAAELPEPEQPSQPPMKTPFGNGDSGAPETPQQIMQDILERQQKIDQQQNQQNNPH